MRTFQTVSLGTWVNKGKREGPRCSSLGPDTTTAEALSAVTAADARDFFEHAGYRPTAQLL